MKDKKRKSTRKWVIPFVIFSVFTFTGLAIWLQYAISMELSPTLITCFYGFCTGELWLLASITKTKEKLKFEEQCLEDESPECNEDI